jgi:hypothetical protein
MDSSETFSATFASPYSPISRRSLRGSEGRRV